MKNQDLNYEKLLYRRQFILAPHYINKFKNWQKANINNKYFLTVHPDLQLLQIKDNQKSLTLLGFILDPYNIDATDKDIIEDLLKKCKSTKDIFEHTNSMGGRWILIFNNNDDIILFSDASGLRQICHSNSLLDKDNIWCASQPGIIAEENKLNFDKEVIDDFINSPQFKNNKEYLWPGTTTPFKEIDQLLPNHYLDLKNNTVHRFWPDKVLKPVSLEQGVKKSAELLKNLIECATKRFDIEFTLTCGYDTRLLLAASKNIGGKYPYLTLIYWNLTEDAPDITISSKLLNKFGFKHEIIKCPAKMSKEFEEIYTKNVVTAHISNGNIVEGLFNKYDDKKVCVRGTVSSEIIREQYIDKVRKPSGKTFAQIANFNNNNFAIKHFGKWLLEAKEYSKKYNVNIFELFGWEQQTGKWQAMTQLEWDIVQENVVPYNCRELLFTMLAVDDKYRKPPNYPLYRAIAKYLWPETLSEPINPHKLTKKNKLKLRLRNLGLYPLFTWIFYKIKK